MGGALAWTVVGLLLLCTLACQRPKWDWQRALKYRDVGAMIPSWTFFAPNPGRTDTRLLWRELRVDGSSSLWHEVLPPTGGMLRSVWNPNKRQSKLITDVGPMVLRQVRRNPESSMALISVPYLVILHRISAEPVTAVCVARQFLVVQTTGVEVATGEFTPLVLSRWHAVEGRSTDDVTQAVLASPARAA